VAHLAYDEFGLFHENAAEWGLALDAPPHVERITVTLADGRMLSGLRWGVGTPTMVLLHGGAQNAHTYDTVALALGGALLCLDLPGHGHSDGGAGGQLDPSSMAADVSEAITALCPDPIMLVGMSLGGLCAIAIAASRPELVARLVLIDITPGVTGDKAAHITDFINGPPGFESFEDLVARTMAFNPTRSESSLRRGILHNAVQLDDGTWVWRWARHRGGVATVSPERVDLWASVASLAMPVVLLRGMAQGSVVDDDDEARFLAEAPHGEVVRVQGAGHSIQGDQPLELAALLASFAR
jgi:pimeloyl-ACP methyl ester carboxylesterase